MHRRLSHKSTRRVTLRETADLYRLDKGWIASSPQLRLQGQWLAAAGFHAGARVTIQITDGQLTITAPAPTPVDADNTAIRLAFARLHDAIEVTR